MKKLLFVMMTLIMGYHGYAQESRSFKFVGTVTDETDKGLLVDYLVDVYEGNTLVTSPKPDNKGRFECLIFNKTKFTISIEMEGYYPKRIVVMADVPDDIKKIPTFKFEVELIRKVDYELIEDADPLATSIFDMPYVIFEYDAELEDFNYREAYTEHIKAKYAEVEEVH